MGSIFDRAAVHPVLACADAMAVALKETADVEVMFMDAGDKRDAMLRLAQVEAQLAALRLRLMAAADDVALAEGARDVAALLTHHTRGDFGANRRDLALAEALDRRWAAVASGLAQGDLNVAQARVICHALDELPAEKVGAEVLAAAEAHLVAQAADFGPRELRVLGRRILDIVAPEIGEQHEAEQLAKEEQRAARRTSLVTTRLGDGTTRITIHVPDAVATRLHTYLEAFTSPRHHTGHQGAGGEGDRIPADRKRGQAFCSLLEALDPKRIPAHGGDATTVIVTVSLEQLRNDLGVGALGPTEKLTAGEVRRLACTAAIIPAVLDGKSEVLDLGRTSQAVQTGPTQGDDPPRPRVPRRRVHHPRRLVRGPSLGHPLGARRTHRPQGRTPALLLAPPPRPRPHLRHQQDAQRRRPIQPADVRSVLVAGLTATGGRRTRDVRHGRRNRGRHIPVCDHRSHCLCSACGCNHDAGGFSRMRGIMAHRLSGPLAVAAVFLVLVAGSGVEGDLRLASSRSGAGVGGVDSAAPPAVVQWHDPRCYENYPTYIPMVSNGWQLQDLHLCQERYGRWTMVRNTSENKVWYFTSPAYSDYWTWEQDLSLPLKVQLFRAAMRRHFKNQGVTPRLTLEPGTETFIPAPNQIRLRQEPYDATVWRLTNLSVNTVRKKAPTAVPVVFGRGSPTRKAFLRCGVSAYQAVERLAADPSGNQVATALGLRGDYTKCATALDNAAQKSSDSSVTLTSGELRRPTLRVRWMQRAERWISPVYRVARYLPRT